MRNADIIESKLYQWTVGKHGRNAMVAVYKRVRDIPYGVLPELNHPREYLRILRTNLGSCTPKHLLLCEMYRRLGLDVLLSVYPYRWAQFQELYPPELWKLAEQMPPVNHLACRVFLNGQYVLVDATVDPPLGCIGLPVTLEWDGLSDTALPVLPTGPEEIYHPVEAELMPPPDLNDTALEFYRRLNEYFESVRNGHAAG